AGTQRRLALGLNGTDDGLPEELHPVRHAARDPPADVEARPDHDDAGQRSRPDGVDVERQTADRERSVRTDLDVGGIGEQRKRDQGHAPLRSDLSIVLAVLARATNWNMARPNTIPQPTWRATTITTIATAVMAPRRTRLDAMKTLFCGPAEPAT